MTIEITEVKLEIQKYKQKQQNFRNDDQRALYCTGLICFDTLIALLNSVELLNQFEKIVFAWCGYDLVPQLSIC